MAVCTLAAISKRTGGGTRMGAGKLEGGRTKVVVASLALLAAAVNAVHARHCAASPATTRSSCCRASSVCAASARRSAARRAAICAATASNTASARRRADTCAMHTPLRCPCVSLASETTAWVAVRSTKMHGPDDYKRAGQTYSCSTADDAPKRTTGEQVGTVGAASVQAQDEWQTNHPNEEASGFL